MKIINDLEKERVILNNIFTSEKKTCTIYISNRLLYISLTTPDAIVR